MFGRKKLKQRILDLESSLSIYEKSYSKLSKDYLALHAFIERVGLRRNDKGQLEKLNK